MPPALPATPLDWFNFKCTSEEDNSARWKTTFFHPPSVYTATFHYFSGVQLKREKLRFDFTLISQCPAAKVRCDCTEMPHAFITSVWLNLLLHTTKTDAETSPKHPSIESIPPFPTRFARLDSMRNFSSICISWSKGTRWEPLCSFQSKETSQPRKT